MEWLAEVSNSSQGSANLGLSAELRNLMKAVGSQLAAPDPTHEAMRDLVQARQAASFDVRKARQRIQSYLSAIAILQESRGHIDTRGGSLGYRMSTGESRILSQRGIAL